MQRHVKTIEKLDDDLNGVAFAGGKKYVVGRTLPGETAELKIRKISGNAVLCNAEKIIVPSEKRIQPPCAYYEKCGGCSLLHTDYDNTLAIKTALVKRKFSSLGFCDVSDTVGNGICGARNKVHIAFFKENGKTKAGFFNEETHRVCDVRKCILHGEWYKKLREILVRWIDGQNISVYNPATGKGVLRFAAGRKIGDELMLTLVQTRTTDADYENLYRELKKQFGEVSLYVNVNAEKTNAVFFDKFIHIAGNNTLNGEICGVKFKLGPNSFFQVNTETASEIYNKVVDEVRGSNADKVIDLYSGIGVTSALFAKNGFQVESVEIVSAAVENAESLAKDNGVKGIKFHTGDVNAIICGLSFDNAVVFADPPRAGTGKETAEAIATKKPDKIIYLSCNLKTLLPDLKIIIENGYEIRSVIPYDMFPATRHVETLVVLNRR